MAEICSLALTFLFSFGKLWRINNHHQMQPRADFSSGVYCELSDCCFYSQQKFCNFVCWQTSINFSAHLNSSFPAEIVNGYTLNKHNIFSSTGNLSFSWSTFFSAVLHFLSTCVCISVTVGSILRWADGSKADLERYIQDPLSKGWIFCGSNHDNDVS